MRETRLLRCPRCASTPCGSERNCVSRRSGNNGRALAGDTAATDSWRTRQGICQVLFAEAILIPVSARGAPLGDHPLRGEHPFVGEGIDELAHGSEGGASSPKRGLVWARNGQRRRWTALAAAVLLAGWATRPATLRARRDPTNGRRVTLLRADRSDSASRTSIPYDRRSSRGLDCCPELSTRTLHFIRHTHLARLPMQVAMQSRLALAVRAAGLGSPAFSKAVTESFTRHGRTLLYRYDRGDLALASPGLRDGTLGDTGTRQRHGEDISLVNECLQAGQSAQFGFDPNRIAFRGVWEGRASRMTISLHANEIWPRALRGLGLLQQRPRTGVVIPRPIPKRASGSSCDARAGMFFAPSRPRRSGSRARVMRCRGNTTSTSGLQGDPCVPFHTRLL